MQYGAEGIRLCMGPLGNTMSVLPATELKPMYNSATLSTIGLMTDLRLVTDHSSARPAIVRIQANIHRPMRIGILAQAQRSLTARASNKFW